MARSSTLPAQTMLDHPARHECNACGRHFAGHTQVSSVPPQIACSSEWLGMNSAMIRHQGARWSRQSLGVDGLSRASVPASNRHQQHTGDAGAEVVGLQLAHGGAGCTAAPSIHNAKRMGTASCTRNARRTEAARVRTWPARMPANHRPVWCSSTPAWCAI